jgi:hypothetical protein
MLPCPIERGSLKLSKGKYNKSGSKRNQNLYIDLYIFEENIQNLKWNESPKL